MFLHLIYLLLLLLFTNHVNGEDRLTESQICFYRCTARCIEDFNSTLNDSILNTCQSQCQQYGNPTLCTTPNCWTNCNDLGPEDSVNGPNSFTEKDDVNGQFISWPPSPTSVFYVVQKKLSGLTSSYDQTDTTLRNSFKIIRPDDENFCEILMARVASVNPLGVSPFSTEQQIDKPKPFISPKLFLKEMSYINEEFVSDFYRANGTIKLVFEFNPENWALGGDDLQVEPMFHIINCAEPDFSQGVPMPEFKRGEEANTIVGLLGSDMMYRKCRFLYYAQKVASTTCGSYTLFHTPSQEDMQTLTINCESVEGAPCVTAERHPSPVCGQIERLEYEVMQPNPSPHSLNLTLNVTFEPMTRTNEGPTLYYVAFYGNATGYKTKEEETFLGVNITNILGKVSNCYEFLDNGLCAHPMNATVFVPGIDMDRLYGITFCAIKDVRNLTYPDFTQDSMSLRPKADKLFVDSKAYTKNHTGAIVGGVVGGVGVLVVLILVFCFYLNKKQARQNQKLKMKITGLETVNAYTDFPKKNDIWEIERRNLIIHNDNKLGSGAFGAVYQGKLIGKSLGHKDANSPLGVNIMRTENCVVAVKMLPEYANEASKTEFLREIELMKTLGYHERLVNMLACVTESEPLCLVVEYCSDGDLLKFLRDRCKYMMKLDDANINYQDPPIDDNYDIEMIITMKQLLMYAVQISYGLEYLSQKGFVHRDVAARNILVNDKKSCKIGDFGLCRYMYADSALYKSKGGRLPLKWMSPEAIRHYEFSTQSDVWAFGILLFEVITLGGCPYPLVQPEDMLSFLENGGRMEQPDNCPDDFYAIMKDCWEGKPEERPDFATLRMKLASQLEDVTEEYSYLKLDAQRDYYNVQYDQQKPDIIMIPEDPDTLSSNQTLTTTLAEEIDRDADIDNTKLANKMIIDDDNASISISLGPSESER